MNAAYQTVKILVGKTEFLAVHYFSAIRVDTLYDSSYNPWKSSSSTEMNGVR
jgi:hypothetical protein